MLTPPFFFLGVPPRPPASLRSKGSAYRGAPTLETMVSPDSFVSASTRHTTPARSPVHTHGPLPLPKIQSQDQAIDPAAAAAAAVATSASAALHRFFDSSQQGLAAQTHQDVAGRDFLLARARPELYQPRGHHLLPLGPLAYSSQFSDDSDSNTPKSKLMSMCSTTRSSPARQFPIPALRPADAVAPGRVNVA